METAMKPTRTILALFVAVLALPMAAVGQHEEASTVLASNDETIDDSVVVGQKSMAEMHQREHGFHLIARCYKRFSKLMHL